MKFGLLLSHQYDRGDDLRRRLDELTDLCHAARDQGFDSVFTLQHFLANMNTPQPISMMAHLLEHSGRMQVGTSVLLLPFFHPVHVAEEFATLDQLSGGRVILGVGAGYRQMEFDAFGIPFNERAQRMAEGIRLVRSLWSEEEVDFEGRFYRVHGQRTGVPPFRKGGPPIWIGAGANRAIERAARLGDAWIAPGNAPAEGWFEKAVALHDQALTAAGKQREGREYPIIHELYIGDDTESAIEAASTYIWKEYSTYAQYEEIGWFRTRWDELMRNAFIVGDVETVTERMEGLARLGFNHLIFRVFWGGLPHETALRTVRRLSEEVMPRLKAAFVS